MIRRLNSDTYSELIEYHKAVRAVAAIALMTGLTLLVAALLVGKTSVFYAVLVFVVMDMAALIAIRLGHDRVAGYTLMLFVPLMVSYLIVNGTGLNDPGILGYSATVISASLLFGRRSIIAFSFFNFILVLGVYLMENYGYHIGWERPTAVPSNFFDLVTIQVLLITSSIVFWLIIGRITRQADRLEELVRLRTSQLEQNNEELRRTQKHLIQKERMASLGKLVSGIAHEVNTPIGNGVTASTYLEQETEKIRTAVIEGACSFAELSGYLDDVSESSQLIFTSLERAQKMVSGFRQLSVDQSAETKREFELPGYLEDVVARFSRDLTAHKVTVSIDCPEPIQIVSYPGQFYQIFTHLMTNSLTHGIAGRDSGEIYIVISCQGDDVRVVFGDNGVGVPVEQLLRIFEPFYSTRIGGDSVGFGLSIVHNIVIQNFDGSIDGHVNSRGGLEIQMSFPGLAAPTAAQPDIESHQS